MQLTRPHSSSHMRPPPPFAWSHPFALTIFILTGCRQKELSITRTS